MSAGSFSRTAAGNRAYPIETLLDIYSRTPPEDKNYRELCKQFPKPDLPAVSVPELDHWLILVESGGGGGL